MTAVEGVNEISQAGRATTERAAGRVVVAGAAPLVDVLRRAAARLDARLRVDAVEGFLHAIGEAGRGEALAVVGAVSLLRGEAAATAAALRKLAPAARLVLIARSDESLAALHALSDGFDDFLIEPFDAEQLGRAIRVERVREIAPAQVAVVTALSVPPNTSTNASSAPPSATPVTPPTRPATPVAIPSRPEPPLALRASSMPSPFASSPASSPVSGGASPRETASVEAAVDASPAPNLPKAPQLSNASSSSAPAAPAAPTASERRESPVSQQSLGDVDLIEQLIRHHGGITDMAVSIVRQESGIAGATWAATPAEVPAGRVAVPVTYRKLAMGVLHAPPPSTAAELSPWAAWLAHWLAMDRQMSELWTSATRDELTGVWNRRYFNQFLRMILERAATERFRVTLLMFDIDGFKKYNDRYGHGAGDDILRETARLMQSVVRTHDVVARVGGDEFAVIFWDAEAPRQPNSQHPPDAVAAARRFQRAICDHRFPKLLEEAPGTLTISGGLASFPWDGHTPEQLIELADSRAMQSKRQGKNAITFGPGAADVCRIN